MRGTTSGRGNWAPSGLKARQHAGALAFYLIEDGEAVFEDLLEAHWAAQQGEIALLDLEHAELAGLGGFCYIG